MEFNTLKSELKRSKVNHCTELIPSHNSLNEIEQFQLNKENFNRIPKVIVVKPFFDLIEVSNP